MSTTGRILRIKQGYNPNSSSIGTQVTAFLWATAAFAVLANAVMAVAAAVSRSRKDHSRKEPDNRPSAQTLADQ